MKTHLTITTLFAVGLALVISSTAPAQTVGRSVTAPKVKVQTRVPIDRQVTRRAGNLPVMRLQAPSDACVFDDNYSMGATNVGTTFCTRKTGKQVLPPERQGRISAVNVPEGYILSLFSSLDGTGPKCLLVGNHAGLETPCDNMARSISLMAGEPWQIETVKAMQSQMQAENADQSGFAPKLKENQEAQARTDAAALKARNIAQAGACPVEVFSTDGSFPNRRCIAIEQSIANVGDNWNDDIERVQVTSGYAQFIGYEGANFQGRRVNLGCGYWELVGDPENEISSIRVEYVSLGDEVYCGTRDQEVNSWR
jgi:hypothetical protein